MLTMLIAACSSKAEALENNVVPDIDDRKSLSLTITYVYENGEEKIPLRGVPFCTCRVSDLKVKSGDASYELLKEFSKTGISFKNMSADSSNKAAELLKKVAEAKGISLLKARTDEDGKVRWRKLKRGMYVVFQEKTHTQSGRKYYSLPFLVSVPSVEPEGEVNFWKYSVEAAPKASTDEKIVPPEKPGTGDKSELYVWAGILIMSSVYLALKYYIEKRNNEINI